MKQFVFISLLLMTTISAFADANISKGSIACLKNANARITVTWDYSNMLIEDMKPEAFLKEKGAEWERDYPAEVAAGESAFDAQFNKKNKKYAQITDDEDAAQYEMIIHVDKFHYGSTAAHLFFGGIARGASIMGTVELIEKATKSVVCSISYDCAGKSDYGNEKRRVLAYQDLAGDLAKLVSKAK